jgi:hypothetical protein
MFAIWDQVFYRVCSPVKQSVRDDCIANPDPSDSDLKKIVAAFKLALTRLSRLLARQFLVRLSSHIQILV